LPVCPDTTPPPEVNCLTCFGVGSAFAMNRKLTHHSWDRRGLIRILAQERDQDETKHQNILHVGGRAFSIGAQIATFASFIAPL
jgi:hypothetical protein